MKTRRSFLKDLGALLSLVSMPLSSARASNVRIMIIGGGVAGTRASVYLKMSLPSASVTLFDHKLKGAYENNYNSISNQYKPIGKDVLDKLDVECVSEKVLEVDPVAKSIILPDGKKYQADFLVIAPGVDFKWKKLKGYQSGIESKILHAWQHPTNENAIWRQLTDMQDAGTVVLSVPKAPYRFPQGAYQRASKIADFLKATNSGAKLLILDDNEDFPLMQSYLDQWNTEYPEGMVEWVSGSQGGIIEHMDIGKRIVVAGGEAIEASVLNIIPEQQAGLIAQRSNLNNNSDWCQVVGETMESTHYKGVYVIGDANDAALDNKTAAVADRQALLCKDSIKSILV